jgi:HSP20 family protein|tara:strand:- start:63 stop:398 length:336 start_codon:yes stop_codon:yes gene_type:complete
MILTMNNAWDLMDEVFKKPQRDTRNMRLEDDVLTMEFDVPGLSKKDINVKVEDSVLYIEGDNEKRTFNKRYSISEDFDVTKTSASVKDGVLTVSIPKMEEKKAKVIEVSVR